MSTNLAIVEPAGDVQKRTGAFYTPPDAVHALVAWAVRGSHERMLDPSCGDGRFLAAHGRSVGVEQDPTAHALARQRAPWSEIFEADFFAWASSTTQRFECAAGNPPFIRYQRFTGETRQRALTLCKTLGAPFSALTSSWAPFLVATAALLKPGGRMAFVVPAEIGHAPYAAPLLKYLVDHFAKVHLTAVRSKVFPELSEDVWLLYAEGFGAATPAIDLAVLDRFVPSPAPPASMVRVSIREWVRWNYRLRPFILPASVREYYRAVVEAPDTARFGDLAKIGIGYVTGANDFFHLRPSAANSAGIPRELLVPAVRNGRVLKDAAVTRRSVQAWLAQDDAVLLLKLAPETFLSPALRRYLDSPAGREARATYKCRNRTPWYVVPDVKIPDAFLAYMSSGGPALVANRAKCVGTNSVHTVGLTGEWSLAKVQRAWGDPFTPLSCEIEGHPLGGGLLKLEPREACRIALVSGSRWTPDARRLIAEGVDTMRRWRHSRGEDTEAL